MSREGDDGLLAARKMPIKSPSGERFLGVLKKKKGGTRAGKTGGKAPDLLPGNARLHGFIRRCATFLKDFEPGRKGDI